MNRFVKTQFVCASCGRVREEANHWFVVARSPVDGEFYLVRSLIPGFPSLAPADFPVCGQECLTKIETKIIAKEEIA